MPAGQQILNSDSKLFFSWVVLASSTVHFFLAWLFGVRKHGFLSECRHSATVVDKILVTFFFPFEILQNTSPVR